MEDIEISKRLRAISIANEWPNILKKCYIHVDLRLKGKTLTGAHCEQRLGMLSQDYYVGNALKAIYEQSWQWQYQKYDIVSQLIRVINSMISNEVRKYKVEQKQSKQLTLLAEPELFLDIADETGGEDENDSAFFDKCHAALKKACENNKKYEEFIQLKLLDKSYPEIAQTLGTSINEAYQLMETIARRAKKILFAENN